MSKQNKKEEEPPLEIIVLLALSLSLLLFPLTGERVVETGMDRAGEMLIIENNTLVSVSPPFLIKGESLATLHDKPIVFEELIECMIGDESGSTTDAYNPKDTDGKPKYGILQYGKDTFKEFCIERYFFRDDIWDSVIQRKCANIMIIDGYCYRWPSCKRCWKKIYGK